MRLTVNKKPILFVPFILLPAFLKQTKFANTSPAHKGSTAFFKFVLSVAQNSPSIKDLLGRHRVRFEDNPVRRPPDPPAKSLSKPPAASKAFRGPPVPYAIASTVEEEESTRLQQG